MSLPTFEQVMELTGTISNHHILQVEEAKALYDTCCAIPDGSTVVEVGCDLGRSSSLIGQIAAAKDFLTIHIDPWQIEPEKAGQWMKVMNEQVSYYPFIVLRMTTELAAFWLARLTPLGIHLAFIDGCHDQDVVVRDLEIVVSRVKAAGYLVAHDYPSAGVSEAIDGFIAEGSWVKVQQAMGLGVWQKLL